MADAKTTFSELVTGPETLVQGVEATLLQRRRAGVLGLAVGLLGAMLQVIAGVVDRGYFKKLTELGTTLTEIVKGEASPVIVIGLVGLVLFGLGLGVYMLLRWTRVLQKDSEEPFRYTVSMDKFKRIATAATKDEEPAKDPPPDNKDPLALLHYDLRERLNARIGRFSLLERRPAAPPGPAHLSMATDRGTRPSPSHIHVAGEYVVRQDRDDRWFIHVMPTVQLGALASPLTMAYPVRYDLGLEKPATLKPAQYEQVVERVYSSVATEIYRKIETDVRTKIDWFPTRHLRAVALFHEAQDMARSNTVDAYDRALKLYSSAQRFFDLALLRRARRRLVKMPLVWQTNARYLQMRARVQIGYVRCQIYRQMTALQTGRKPNAIYECIWRMDDVIEDLRAVHRRLIKTDTKRSEAKAQILGYFTFRRDHFLRWLMRRPLEPDFSRQRQILFDAYTVAAMAHAVLANATRARAKLDAAIAVDPSLRERDPIHLVAEAEISPDLKRRIKLLREATDLSPSFQIAQYRLAQATDLLFRDENQLSPERVADVIRQYDEVLRINPGNIAAIASKGYLYWLTRQRDAAEKCFREGIEFKSIVRETSIAELTYGLARTLAEGGKYNEAFDQFMQSAAVDPDVAAWTLTPGQSRAQGRYYNRISKAMVQRFVEYARKVELAFRFDETNSLGHAVRSFVDNDTANAYLNDYFRSGDPDSLEEATSTLRKIEERKPDNPIVHFNLAVAYDWGEKYIDALASIDRAVKLAPEWQAARVSQITKTVSPYYLDAVEVQIRQKKEELQKLRETETARAAAPRAGDGAAKESAATPPTEEPMPTVGLSQKERQLLRPRSGTQTEPESLPPPVTQPLPGAVKGHRLDSGEGLWGGKATFGNQKRELEQQLENIRQSYQPNLRRALRDLTHDSRLWHLLEPESPEAPPTEWADRALKLDSLPGLRWEQLDGSDVLALKSVAYATSQSALKEHKDAVDRKPELDEVQESLRISARLHLFLARRFLPEDIDLCSGLTGIRTVQGKRSSRTIQAVVADIVAFWLEEDPWHYWALKFWIESLRPDKLVNLAECQIYSRFHDSRRLSIVVEQLFFELHEGRLSAPGNELFAHSWEIAHQAARLCVREASSHQRCHYNLGRILALKKSWEEAVSAFDEAVRASQADPDLPANTLRTARAEAYENYGDELQGQGRFADAFDLYLQLIEIEPSRRTANDKIAAAWAALPSKGERTRAADQVRELVNNRMALPDTDESERKSMQDLLQRLRIGEYFGPRGSTRRHLVAPVTIEVAINLVDLIAKGSELHPDLTAEVDALRANLISTMGVRLPGFSFRDAEGNLPPGSYVINLDDTPVVRGNLEVTESFYPGPLDPSAIKLVHARTQVDPLTETPGWWLPDSQAHTLNLRAGSLIGPRTFMMRHVEAVLRSHLANFVGHSPLSWMMDEFKLPAEQKVQDRTERAAFITALRSLLFERVPIAPLADLLTAWPAIRAAHAHLRAQVEALRSLPALRPRLPGNDARHSLFEIGPKLQSSLRDNLHNPERVPVLALSPDLCQSILAAIREGLPADLRATPAALVINEASLRPHLRELVKLEWPSVPVLAVAELGAQALAQARTPIEVE